MKRIACLFFVLCLVLSLSTGVTATSELQHEYSTIANSGIRHEVCTTLLGTSASSYYTGTYTYDNLSNLSSSQLLTTLRTLMKTTHTKNSTYDQCRSMAVKTDCQNGDGKTISLIYTSYVATESDSYKYDSSKGWNREHVWPKSLGGFETSGPGADLHHIRPSDQPVNSARGNLKYGEVTNGKTATGAPYTGYAEGGTYNSTYFEPLDNVKGDVARICLYVYVRYGGEYSKCSSITNVFQSVDVLLEWCALDPVDTWEMGRNEVVAAYQGNRNVFIDYPELAWLLFGKDIPTDMVTPSGEAAGTSSTVCAHSSTTVKDASAATCTKAGYTGDTYCADCGKLLQSGTAIAATGHVNKNGDNQCDVCNAAMTCGHGSTEVTGAIDAGCGTEGYTGDTCCVYCGAVITTGEAIPATGQHSFGDWTVTKEATQTETGTKEHTCTVCGQSETEEIPMVEAPATEPSVTEPSVTEPSVTDPAVTGPNATEPVSGGENDDSIPTWVIAIAVVIVGCTVVGVVLLIKERKSK